MAQQTIPLPSPGVTSSALLLNWSIRANSRPQIDAGLVAGGGAAFIERFTIWASNQNINVLLQLSATQTGSGSSAGPELTDALEGYARALVLSSGGREVVFPGPNNAGATGSRDTSEPYRWVINNFRATWEPFFNAYVRGSAISLLLDDGVVPPLALADFDATGLQMDTLALMAVSGGAAATRWLYQSAARGGSDAVLAGELGIGPNNTVFEGIRYRASQGRIILNDNDNPQALDLSRYYGAGRPGNDLTFYFQTQDDGVFSFPIAGANTAGVGGNFLQLNAPAALQTVLGQLATGERFIMGFGRAAPAGHGLRIGGKSVMGLRIGGKVVGGLRIGGKVIA